MSETGDAAVAGGGPDHGTHGFTLIEALVVMAVSALIAGIMFPQLEQSLAFLQFRSAAVSVRAGLERGRADALRQDADVRFAVADSERSFIISGEAPTDLPGSVRLRQAGARAIVFHGDGTSSGGEIAVSAGERRLVVAISPDTGLPRNAG